MSDPAVILDIDGTLVDSNYHHTIAWFRALRDEGFTPPIWKIHRHIGMGGDRMVEAVAGEEAEAEHGDDIREREGELYMDMIGEVLALDGAQELIAELRRAERAVVLASSAKPEEVEHYVDLLDVRDAVDGWTDSGDVETTKPAPDLVEAALAKVGTRDAVLIGDSTWDALAAGRAGIPFIGVLTGGYSATELREAGATAVFDSLPALIRELRESSQESILSAATR
jgi:HAD superfamily hydrolase (TIGR01509 family)